MPERTDQRTLLHGLLRAVFVGNTYAQRWPNQANGPISEPDDDAQNNTLAKRKAARASNGLGWSGCARRSRAAFGEVNWLRAHHYSDVGTAFSLRSQAVLRTERA